MIGRMPSDASSARGPTSRRTLLRLAGWAVAGAGNVVLSGCGIRLEGPRPEPTTTPRRQPVPDEAVLLTGLDDVTRLTRAAADLTPADDLTRRLATIHGTQALVLRDALRRAGVPDDVVSAATSPTAGATSSTATASPTTSGSATAGASTSTPAPLTRAQLVEAEVAALTADALDALSGTSAAHRPMLTAIAACRAAAATSLGATVTWPPAPPLPSSAAAPLLEATRAVVYGFEIVAARLLGAARNPALATLAQLRRREAVLAGAAGAKAAPDPLGYALPHPVTTPDAARRLATSVLTGLVKRGLDPLATLPRGSAALGAVVRLQAEALTVGSSWGVALTPFPGLTYP